MNLVIENAFLPGRKIATTWSDYIQTWEKQYNYTSKNPSYDLYVINRPLTYLFEDDHIRELYKWKNNTGDRLSAKKEGSVENNIVANRTIIQQLAETWNQPLFNQHFGRISTVWQIFLMHIIQPDRFPIFDQHVYRAYVYLRRGELDELKGTIKKQLSLYDAYLTFFEDIQRSSQCSPRTIDKALWAFGKHIKV